MIDLLEWSTITMSGLLVVGRMEGVIVLPPSGCLPSRSENGLHCGDSANILSSGYTFLKVHYCMCRCIGPAATLLDSS